MSQAIYQPGLSFRRYREIGSGSPILTVNATLLKEPTPLHAKFAMENNKPDSEALCLGDAVHKAILEPDAFENHFEDFYMLCTTSGLDTKKARDQRILYPDKILLSQEMIDQIRWMRDAVYRHRLAANLLSQCSHRELSGVAPDPEFSIVRKIRIDACRGLGQAGEQWSPFMLDLKTTRNIAEFRREIFKHHYDIQAAYYQDTDAMITGRPRETFLFIAVSNTAPYCARVHGLLPDQIAKARDTYRNRLAALVTAAANNQWEAWDHESEPVAVQF